MTTIEHECRVAWEQAMYDDIVRAVAQHFAVPASIARARAIELGLMPNPNRSEGEGQ